MSHRTAKQIRKETRKHLDLIFGASFDALSKLVRNRPKYIPKIVWVLLYLPLFKAKYWHLIFKNI